MTFWDYFQAIAIICLVIFATFYVSRIVAKNARGAAWKGSGLKLVGTIPLGKDKAVAVVEIGNYAYILGVGGQRVERLDKIELSELGFTREPSAPAEFPADFKTALMHRLKKTHD